MKLADVTFEADVLPPGGTLRAAILFARTAEAGTVDVEVKWQTAGKGTTDSGVVASFAFEIGPEVRRIEARLPLLPLTYGGELVRIGWGVSLKRRGLFSPDVEHHPFEVRAAPPT